MSKIFVTVSIFVVLGAMLSAAGAVSSDTTYCKTAMSKDKMLDKFLRYVRVSSQSQYGSDPAAWGGEQGNTGTKQYFAMTPEQSYSLHPWPKENELPQ